MKQTLLSILMATTLAQATESKLWYEKPATRWEQEALPIGNGRLGAMVFVSSISVLPEYAAWVDTEAASNR